MSVLDAEQKRAVEEEAPRHGLHIMPNSADEGRTDFRLIRCFRFRKLSRETADEECRVRIASGADDARGERSLSARHVQEGRRHGNRAYAY